MFLAKSGSVSLADLVGKRVDIWCDDYKCWYPGDVVASKNAPAAADETIINLDKPAALELQINYDDWEVEWIKLCDHRVSWHLPLQGRDADLSSGKE